MPRFRKKAVVVDAEQFMPSDNAKAGDAITLLGTEFNLIDGRILGPIIVIHTLEGDVYARCGDWIIRGIKGELYPCQHEIFEAIYESVGNEDIAT